MARLIRVNDVAVAAMSPFRLSGGAEARALECLTTAVYYEARGEGADGMAAVAQVVLNRVRHPAFPKSVCAVVFQGCQFSFACGGMNGRRNAVMWSRSREIAEAALAGEVMSRVGTATHFHATRLNPRWAGLRRVATIGQHVFYSYVGRRGATGTFLEADATAEGRRSAAPRTAETPAYAMLPSEQPGAPSPLPPAAAPTDTATLAEAAPSATDAIVIETPPPVAVPAVEPLSAPAPVI